MTDMLRDPHGAVEMVRYWLNSLALHAKGAPILLVGTHKDQAWPVVAGERPFKVMVPLRAVDVGS